uniref:DEUBAD domain-containing protein n=1 Tax=Panagrolaimus superbus TaxID=310955 RepID=A0A914ZHA3_9BILA
MPMNTPDVENLPIPAIAGAFNIEQFNRLTSSVQHAIPLQQFEELLTLPAFIQSKEQPEPFSTLLQRCRGKVLTKDPAFNNVADPENEQLNAFLNNPTVWRPWRTPETSGAFATALADESLDLNDIVEDGHVADIDIIQSAVDTVREIPPENQIFADVQSAPSNEENVSPSNNTTTSVFDVQTT